MLLLGSLLSGIGAGYFYWRIYIVDSHVRYSCHSEVVAWERGLRRAPYYNEEHFLEIEREARKRAFSRWSFRTLEVEHGDDYRRCLLQTFQAANLGNLDWALVEMRNFALWAMLLFIVSSLARPTIILARWIAMR